MKLSLVRRILKEDLSRSGEIPKWVDGFLSTLNDFLEQVVRALNGRLTFADNFQCIEKAIALPHNKEITITTGSQLRVKGVLGLDFGGEELTSFQWYRGAANTVVLKASYVDTSASPVSTLTILLE